MKNIEIFARNPNNFSINKQIAFLIMLLLACGFLCFPNTSTAQMKLEDTVPPPLNILTKNEKKQLDAETKMKNRTKLALELMEIRLLKSAELLEQNKYRNSLDELGGFRALVSNTLKYLNQFQNQKSSLKNFKRFEITLRQFLPKLELIRREMPVEYGQHVKNMMIFVRDTRSKAVQPMFGKTVLSEGSK